MFLIIINIIIFSQQVISQDPFCGDTLCNGAEKCSTCPQDCGTCCGNGVIDSGESQLTCCNDVPCGSGFVCDKSTHACVQCADDGDCGDGKCFKNKCVECIKDADCEERDNWFGTGTCSTNNKYFVEKGETIGGKCDVATNVCTGKRIPTTRDIQCQAKGKQTYCQNNKCGCDEGFAPCETLSSCTKEKVLEIGDNCGCDLQCKSDLCYQGKCFEALTGKITATSLIAKIGESVQVSAKVVNKLDDTYDAHLIMRGPKEGGGIIFTGSSGTQSCNPSFCETTIKLGKKSAGEFWVKLEGNEPGEIELSGEIDYNYAGVTRTYDIEPIKITFVACGDGTCSHEEGETAENCCSDCGYPLNSLYYTYTCPTTGKGYTSEINWMNILWTFIAVVVLVLIIIAIVYSKKLKAGTKLMELRNRTAKEKKQESEKERFARQRRERSRIHKALKMVGEDITSKKTAPSVSTIKKRIAQKVGIKDFDDRLLKEEYMSFVEEKAKSNNKEKKTQKYCKKCGAALRAGAKFCKKCGKKI